MIRGRLVPLTIRSAPYGGKGKSCAFVGDKAPDDKALAKAVDRLLQSPSFGERWGRHWLTSREQIGLIQGINRDLLGKQPGNTELDGVIQSFGLAYRIQTSVPGVPDLAPENPGGMARRADGN